MSTATAKKPKTGSLGTAIDVDYDKLVVGDNVRSDLPDIDGLAALIATEGLLQPLTVEALEGGKYLIAFGHRRHAAIGRLRKSKQWVGPVRCELREYTDSDRVIAQLVENLGRVDLNPVDEALGMQALVVEYELDIPEVARRLNRSEAQVKERVALCSLPDVGLQLVRDGKLKLGVAALLATKAPAPLIERLLRSPDYRIANEDQLNNEIKTYAKEEKLKELRKILQHESDAVASKHQSYMSPAGLARREYKITSPAALRKLLVELTLTSKDQARVDNRYDGPYLTVWSPDGKSPEAVAANQDLTRIQNERELNDMPDAAAREWLAKVQEMQAIADEREGALEDARAAHRAMFVASVTAKDFAGIIIQHFAGEAAWVLFNSRHQESDYSRIRFDRMREALGWPEAEPEFWKSKTETEFRAMVAKDAKTTTRAAVAYALMQQNLLRDQFQASFTAATAEQFPELVMPELPESLKPYYDPDEIYDLDAVSDIVYRTIEKMPVESDGDDENENEE